jgi:hypothetical protein
MTLRIPDCDQATDGYFRCRVWLKQAIRALNNAGIISCPDADVVVNGELRKVIMMQSHWEPAASRFTSLSTPYNLDREIPCPRPTQEF